MEVQETTAKVPILAREKVKTLGRPIDLLKFISTLFYVMKISGKESCTGNFIIKINFIVGLC